MRDRIKKNWFVLVFAAVAIAGMIGIGIAEDDRPEVEQLISQRDSLTSQAQTLSMAITDLDAEIESLRSVREKYSRIQAIALSKAQEISQKIQQLRTAETSEPVAVPQAPLTAPVE